MSERSATIGDRFLHRLREISLRSGDRQMYSKVQEMRVHRHV